MNTTKKTGWIDVMSLVRNPMDIEEDNYYIVTFSNGDYALFTGRKILSGDSRIENVYDVQCIMDILIKVDKFEKTKRSREKNLKFVDRE